MRVVLLLPVLALLGGCNWVMNVSGLSAEANKAVGASCRQTGRSLEECYRRNPDADPAQIFAGWREMHEYMAKHNLQTVAPPPEPPPPVAAKPAVKGGNTDATAAAEHGEVAASESLSGTPSALGKSDPQVDAVLKALRARDDAEQKLKETAKEAAKNADEQRLLDALRNAQKPAEGKPASGGH